MSWSGRRRVSPIWQSGRSLGRKCHYFRSSSWECCRLYAGRDAETPFVRTPSKGLSWAVWQPNVFAVDSACTGCRWARSKAWMCSGRHQVAVECWLTCAVGCCRHARRGLKNGSGTATAGTKTPSARPWLRNNTANTTRNSSHEFQGPFEMKGGLHVVWSGYKATIESRSSENVGGTRRSARRRWPPRPIRRVV
jgi:hypothetical protein